MKIPLLITVEKHPAFDEQEGGGGPGAADDSSGHQQCVLENNFEGDSRGLCETKRIALYIYLMI